jgi:hypothetical protein
MADEQQNQNQEQQALMKNLTEAYQITFGSNEGKKSIRRSRS